MSGFPSALAGFHHTRRCVFRDVVFYFILLYTLCMDMAFSGWGAGASIYEGEERG